MLLLEETDTAGQAWDDPIAKADLAQFEKLVMQINQLAELHAGVTPDQHRVTEAASEACEFSRQLLFRMHRVSRARVREIITSFGNAVQALGALRAAALNAADAAALNRFDQYVKHIARRVTLLERVIDGRGEPQLGDPLENRQG